MEKKDRQEKEMIKTKLTPEKTHAHIHTQRKTEMKLNGIKYNNRKIGNILKC